MNRLLLAAALLSVATAASAADMQARPYTRAPPPLVSPAYNWSGFYIGAMGGYGWDSGDFSGGFGGGTIGYNWQFPGSQFVFGIEVDAAGATIKDSLTADVGDGIMATEELKINSFGSVTGRAGVAWDAALFYAKGGFAWACRKDSISVPEFGLNVSDSQTHTDTPSAAASNICSRRTGRPRASICTPASAARPTIWAANWNCSTPALSTSTPSRSA